MRPITSHNGANIEDPSRHSQPAYHLSAIGAQFVMSTTGRLVRVKPAEYTRVKKISGSRRITLSSGSMGTAAKRRCSSTTSSLLKTETLDFCLDCLTDIPCRCLSKEDLSIGAQNGYTSPRICTQTIGTLESPNLLRLLCDEDY